MVGVGAECAGGPGTGKAEVGAGAGREVLVGEGAALREALRVEWMEAVVREVAASVALAAAWEVVEAAQLVSILALPPPPVE